MRVDRPLVVPAPGGSVEDVLKDELRQLLRELAQATGAVSVAIAHPDHPELSELPGLATGPWRPGRHEAELEGPPELRSSATHSMSVPVGGGAVLRAGFLHAEEPPDPNGRAAALERAARALRACARRWDVGTLPPLAFPETSRSPRGLILSRVRSYLTALVGSLGMDNAVVTLRARVLASARPLGEMHRAQIPFTVRRVAAEADRRRGARLVELARRAGRRGLLRARLLVRRLPGRLLLAPLLGRLRATPGPAGHPRAVAPAQPARRADPRSGPDRAAARLSFDGARRFHRRRGSGSVDGLRPLSCLSRRSSGAAPPTRPTTASRSSSIRASRSRSRPRPAPAPTSWPASTARSTCGSAWA